MKYLDISEGLLCWTQTISEVLAENKIDAQVCWDVAGSRFVATLTVGKYTETTATVFTPMILSESDWKSCFRYVIDDVLDEIGRKVLRDYANENKSRSNI